MKKLLFIALSVSLLPCFGQWIWKNNDRYIEREKTRREKSRRKAANEKEKERKAEKRQAEAEKQFERINVINAGKNIYGLQANSPQDSYGKKIEHKKTHDRFVDFIVSVKERLSPSSTICYIRKKVKIKSKTSSMPSSEDYTGYCIVHIAGRDMSKVADNQTFPVPDKENLVRVGEINHRGCVIASYEFRKR